MKFLGPSLRVVQLTEDIFELAGAVCRSVIHSRDFDIPPEGEAGNSPRFRLLAELKQKLKGLPVDFYDEMKPGMYLLIDTFKRPAEWGRRVPGMFVNYGPRPYPLRILHVPGRSQATNTLELESSLQASKSNLSKSLPIESVSVPLDPFIEGTGYMKGGGHGRRTDKWPAGMPMVPPLD